MCLPVVPPNRAEPCDGLANLFMEYTKTHRPQPSTPWSGESPSNKPENQDVQGLLPCIGLYGVVFYEGVRIVVIGSAGFVLAVWALRLDSRPVVAVPPLDLPTVAASAGSSPRRCG